MAVIHAVPEAEARHAVAALAHAGVAAHTSPDDRGFSVTVADGDVARAVTALHNAELPRREEPGFVEAWGERSLVATAAEERARAAQATAGELARTLESLDGVLDARVHLALPTADASGEAPRRPTASVMLRYEPAERPLGEWQIRALVAAAVEGMRPEEVTVVFVRRAARARPPVATTTTLGITVAARDAGRVRGLVWVAVAALTALAALVATRLRRRGGAPS